MIKISTIVLTCVVIIWQDLIGHADLGSYTFSFTGENIPAAGVMMLKLQLAD